MLRGFQRFRGPILGVAHYATQVGNPFALAKLKEAYMRQNKAAFFNVVNGTPNFSEYELEEAAELAVVLGEINALQIIIRKLDNSLLHGQLLRKAICCEKPEVVLFLLQKVTLEPEDKINAAVQATQQKLTQISLYVLDAIEKDLIAPTKLNTEAISEYARTLNYVLSKCGENGLLLVLMFLLDSAVFARLINNAYIGQSLNNASIKGFKDSVMYILGKCPNIDENFLIVASRNAKLRGHFEIAKVIDDILTPFKMPLFISQRFKPGTASYYKERDQTFEMLNEAYTKKGTKKKQ